MRSSFIILICLLLPGIAISQNVTIDSLVRVTITTKNDSIKSLAYVELASNYAGYDTMKCRQALANAWSIISRHQWNYNTGYYYICKSDVEFYQGQYDLSLRLSDTAIQFFSKAAMEGDPATRKEANFLLADMVASQGTTYQTMNQRDTAMVYLLRGLELLEKTDHPNKSGKIGTCLINIGTLYFGLGQNDKALQYNLKAIPYQLAAGDDEMISYTYVFVGSTYTQLNKYDSAKFYLQKASTYVNRLNKPSVNIEYYGKTGLLHANLKEWPQAIANYEKAYSNALSINDTYNQAFNQRLIAEAYYNQGNYEKAKAAGLKSLALIQANKYEAEALRLYYPLSQIYAAKKDYANAHKYLSLWGDLIRAKNQADVKKKINELETKYQAEKKEAAIQQLEKDKEIQKLSLSKKTTLNYILVGSVIVLVLLGTLLWRNLHNKQQLAWQRELLQAQRISELEKDKQLVAVDAMLKGQEEERGRLAKDLHDGLGGLLSGVKFSLSNMKDNFIMPSGEVPVFERSLDMIDTAIKELRRVAHNMMPEMLLKYGLDEALREYCSNVNGTGVLKVVYQSFGMKSRLNSSTEITVYRIVQELLNNILKHASAGEALVQLVKEGNRLSVLVEDNGKGFDTATLAAQTGAGWANIQSRINYLKGHAELSSEPGKGTTVNIELNV